MNTGTFIINTHVTVNYINKMPFPVPGLATVVVVVDIHCRNTQFSPHIDQIVRSLDQRHVDLLVITKHLKRTRCISSQKSKLLVKIATDRHFDMRTRISCFLEAVVNDVPTKALYKALCKHGYDDLFHLLLSRRFFNPTIVGNVELPNNTFAYKRYQILRRCIDNDCYNEGPRKALEQEDTEKTDSFKISKTQRLLDDLVIIKLSRVQLYGANESDTRRELLKEMFQLRTDNLDRTFLDLTYHSKMAVTAAKSGDTPSSLFSVQQTMSLICNCRPCFATVMALNDVMYAYQELNFLNRNSDFRQEAVDHSRLAYHIMESSTFDAVQHQWKRVNLLFKVSNILNFKPRSM